MGANLLTRTAHALGGLFRRTPPRGRILHEPSELDTLFGVEITNEKCRRMLKAAAYGDPVDQNALFDVMLQTDGRLRSVFKTRLVGLTALDWELLPADQVGKNPRLRGESAKASEALEYCLSVLAELEGLDAALAHMAQAIGRGLVCVEVIWDRVDGAMRPVRLEPVRFDLPHSDAVDHRRLRIRTRDNWNGIAIDEQPAGKFLTHNPETMGGGRFTGGILRACVFDWLLKRFGKKAWGIGLELFGLPITIGRYGPTADDATKQEMRRMIRDLGIGRGGIMPAGCEVVFQETKVSGEFPHERLIKIVDEEYAVEFLGATLTVQMDEGGGSYAASQTHDLVRKDLRDDDIRNEGRTLREQLLAPMVVYAFGEEWRGLAPYFARVVEQRKDLQQTGQLLSTAINELGMEIPAEFAVQELGLPLVEGANLKAALPGRRAGVEALPLNDGGHAVARHDGCGGELLSPHGTMLRVLAARKSRIAGFMVWVTSATAALGLHVDALVAQVASLVERTGDLPQTLRELPMVFDAVQREDVVELETELLLAGRLAGMEGLRRTAASLHLSAHADIRFEKIPFVAAVERLRDRLGLPPEKFLDLDAEARSRAWRVALVNDLDLLAVIHTNLVRAVAEGETARSFRERLGGLVTRAGWSGPNPWHCDLVHYQNFVMAHSAGRYGEYAEFGVKAWRFVASGYSCPLCGPLVGKVFALNDRRYWPPLHFWCDCQDEPVFDEEIAPGMVSRSREISTPALDELRAKRSALQWDPASYAALEPLRLGRWPGEFQPAIEALAQRLNWEVEK